MSNNLETAVFGGGCFWCTEAIFTRLRGVESVESGYAGGSTANPTYEQVSSGDTGHAESIKIEFDPSQIKYEDLLNVFFTMHDPTTLNRQGHDIGPQYRSAVFYISDEQKVTAENFIKQLATDKVYDDPIVTEVTKLDKFWPAESYHQRYYETNQDKPYCSFVISPKIAKLRQKFAPLLQPEA
ncbi:MAG: peptide-methionine (S)-S-oxide reductase MsrA [Candidatus Doudnabacteria bacterium]|nr:peptide-methionine (S)-S-oxide reductase MsrA [Candidatus Doudnabacteria bacterium]